MQSLDVEKTYNILYPIVAYFHRNGCAPGCVFEFVSCSVDSRTAYGKRKVWEDKSLSVIEDVDITETDIHSIRSAWCTLGAMCEYLDRRNVKRSIVFTALVQIYTHLDIKKYISSNI